MSIGTKTFLIYCYQCEDDLESMIDELQENEKSKNQVEKMRQFCDKVKEFMYRYLKGDNNKPEIENNLNSSPQKEENQDEIKNNMSMRNT